MCTCACTIHWLWSTSVITYCLYLVAITVRFSETTYSVDEDDGPARPVIILSNPSSMNFNVTVNSNDVSATGK